MIYLIVVLIVSLLLNVFSLWYGKKILEKLLFVSENILFCKKSVDTYSDHLKYVYELDTFYGDETLKSLLEHTVEVRKDILEFEEIYNLIEEEDFEEEEENSEGQGEEESLLHESPRREDT